MPLRAMVAHAFTNWRAILLVAALPALAGIAAALFTPVQYTAESTLIVFVGRDSADISGLKAVNLSVNGLKEVNSEIDIVLSGDVMRDALRRIGPTTLFPALGRRRLLGLLPALDEEARIRAAERQFRERVGASVQLDTNIVRVAFTFPDRDLAITGLRSVIDAYLAHRRDVFTNANSSFLRTQLDTYTERLKEIDAQITTVKSDHQVLDIKQDVALAGTMLSSLQQRRDQLRERRQAAQSEAEVAAAKLAVLPREVQASREQTNQVSNDDSRNTLLRLQVERDHLAAQYRADYPAVVELDRKIASARAGISSAARANFYSSRNERSPAYEQMQGRMLAAQVEASALGKPMQELDSQIAQARQRTDALRSAESTLQEMERTREVIVSNYRQFALREAAARIDEDANRVRNANVRVVQAPDAPNSGSNTRWHLLAAGLFAGVAFGAAAGVLLTVLRRVYLLPVEAERHLGIPVLADIPVSEAQFTGPVARREVAGLASLLLDGREPGEKPVFQFICDDEAGLTATLVRTLATEFAATHGLRTLIIDLQTPPKAEPAAERQEPLAIRPTNVTNLWIVPNGAATALASARTLAARSRELLDTLRRDHEVVLVIGPSDNANHAARRLARLVDLNILVLRANHTRAPVAEALCASLAAVGANVCGFVFGGGRAYVPQAILRWL